VPDCRHGLLDTQLNHYNLGGGMRTRSYGLLALVLIAIAVRMSVVLPAQTSETNRNRQVVRRHLELMNRGDWRQAAAFFAPDVPHRSGNWQTGTEAVFRGKTLLTDNLKDIFRTFPDWKLEIVEMVAEAIQSSFVAASAAPTEASPLGPSMADSWSACSPPVSTLRCSTSIGTRFAME
jgi:hypothetical protein